MTNTLWQLDDVTLAGRETPRLDGVSARIVAGTTAVIGWSGAGKTSLLNCLVEFETPDSGTIERHFAGRDGRLPLFWVPQNGGFWSHLTAAEHLEAVLPEAAEASRAQDFLSRFELTDAAAARPDQMSQGQRDRLAVARALASGAEVLVMDEPLAHVDEARLAQFWDVVREHCEHTQTSLVVATHRGETVMREAERALCLADGRVCFDGTVRDLYVDPPNEQTAQYLGPTNWLTADDATHWLGNRQDRAASYRPERISLVRADDGPCVVEASRWVGPIEEVQLRHEPSGETREFCHRSNGAPLERGQRVAVNVLLALLVCLFQFGCDETTDPQLSVREVDHWSIPAKDLRIPAPRSLDIGPDGEVYALDTAGRVLVFDSSGSVLREWQMPEYEVGKPEDICVLADGRIAVADTHYHRVVFFDTQGNVTKMLGSFGRGPGEFKYPVALAEDDEQNLYVCEYGDNDRVQKFTRDGEFVSEFGSFGTDEGQFQRPSGLVWHEGRVYVADAINDRIQVFRDTGEFEHVLTDSARPYRLQYPYDLVLGGDGDLYTIEYGAGRVTRLALNGKLVGRFGTTGGGMNQFVTPWGITIDDEGTIFVADTGNRRIVRLSR